MNEIGGDNVRATIGNYKGVMLCSRPNENLQIERDKPFVTRVDPKAQIGINPIRKIYEIARKRNYMTMLKRHREWLENYKERVKEKKEEQKMVESKANEKFHKIREMAANDRIKTKELKKEYQELQGKILGDLSHEGLSKDNKLSKLTSANLEKLNENSTNKNSIKANKKKKEKPKWAITEKELEVENEKECDELLDFAKNLDYENFLADLEIKSLIKSLKQRIDDLKQNEKKIENVDIDPHKEQNDNVSNKEGDYLEQKIIKIDQNLKENQINEQNEKESQSQKSRKTIQSIKSDIEKKEQIKDSDWDKYSSTLEKKKISLEDKIAKQVADEILMNYKPLKQIHSNSSIRKILEAEAKKHLELEFNINGPKITITKNNKNNNLRASNLPYLHRNPAV